MKPGKGGVETGAMFEISLQGLRGQNLLEMGEEQ